MDLNDYVEEIRKAYKAEDYLKVDELEKEYGGMRVTYKSAEKLYADLLALTASFIVVLENKDQIHHDMLLRVLEEKELLDEEDMDKLKTWEQQLKESLEGEN